MTNYCHIRQTEVRDMLPVGAQLADEQLTIIAQGEFTPGREGAYPTLEVVCAREPDDVSDPTRVYSVHTAVVHCTDGGMSAPTIAGLSLISGRYDLTLDDAKRVLDERASA